MKPFHLAHVAGPLYLSNKVWPERDLPAIHNLGIGAIVNLTDDHRYDLPTPIAYLHCGFPDGLPVAPERLQPVFEFIDRYRGSTNVLVHCAAGSSRSAGVIAGQLLREHPEWDWEQALVAVNARSSAWVAVEIRDSVLACLGHDDAPDGSELDPSDAETIRELERACGMNLPRVSSIHGTTRGYVSANGRVAGLGLHGLALAEIPDSLLRLTAIRDLAVTGNAIEVLPDSIAQVNGLRSLNLADNRLRELPDAIGELTDLRVLNLARNQITRLPDRIGGLANLDRLFLHSNLLAQLPDAIEGCSQLSELDLHDNRLTRLPSAVGKLARLKYLSVATNALDEIPDAVCDLPALEALNVGHNRLERLPAELGRLPMLDKLNVSSNQLRALPKSMRRLSKLRRLNVGLNGFSPWPESITAWLAQLRNAGCYLVGAEETRSRVELPVHTGGGCNHAAPDSGDMILVRSIEDVREPNRCGMVNPSRAYRMMNRIVLDITYKCSLDCPNCNRLCGVARRSDEIPVSTIREFVDTSIAMNKQWAHIYIAGGEPALHSNVEGVFAEILRYMAHYKRTYGSRLLVKYFTSSHAPKSKRILANLPEEFIVVDTHKNDSNTRFKPVFVAPIDLGYYDDANLRPCQESYQCGIALNYRGYYPCAVAAAIDDVMLGGKLAVPRLEDVTFERMAAILHETCRYCGHYFEPLGFRRESRLMVSETWQRFFETGVRPGEPVGA